MTNVYIVEVLKRCPNFMGIYDRESVAVEAFSKDDLDKRVKRDRPRQTS